MNSETESARRSHVHEEVSLTTKGPAQERIPLEVLKSSQKSFLLFASFLLGVEARGHDPLVAEADEGGFECQGQVGFLLQDCVLDRYVSVPDAREGGTAFLVRADEIYIGISGKNEYYWNDK